MSKKGEVVWVKLLCVKCGAKAKYGESVDALVRVFVSSKQDFHLCRPCHAAFGRIIKRWLTSSKGEECC